MAGDVTCCGYAWSFSALFHLAVTTGLRQGELLGLKLSDIDWDNKQTHVQRQSQMITGKGLLFTELKTKTSKRVVAVGDLTIEKLNNHKEIQYKLRLFAGDRW